jgi:nitrile hydratase
MIINTPEQRRQVAGIIARSWTDAAYKQDLLSDPKGTLAAAGIEVPPEAALTALEDTAACHHVILSDTKLPDPQIVSELPPRPGFYKAYAYAYNRALTDSGFRQELQEEPTATFRGLGVNLPPEAEVKVFESAPDQLYFVLPLPPSTRVTSSSPELAAAPAPPGSIVVTQANVNTSVNVVTLACVEGIVEVAEAVAVSAIVTGCQTVQVVGPVVVTVAVLV